MKTKAMQRLESARGWFDETMSLMRECMIETTQTMDLSEEDLSSIETIQTLINNAIEQIRRDDGDDFDNALFWAFRYGLGRQSYAVSDIAELLIKNWDKIDPKHQDIIHTDIDHAIERGHAGAQMDEKTWAKVSALPTTRTDDLINKLGGNCE